MYILHAASETPLHIQLYEALKYDITTTLTIGRKLPSIRKISQEYKISKNTVESAYAQLYAEGYIESRPKSGYYVADADYKPLMPTKPILPHEQYPREYLYDFFPARLSKSSFPLKLWKRLSMKVLNDTLDMGGYFDGQGDYGLRYEIAQYLMQSRGVVCDVSQIVIGGAFVDSITIIADLLKPTHPNFAIENPGYAVPRTVFERYGFTIHPVSVDHNGLKIEDMIRTRANAVYITPSHQYPTGVSIPVSNRLKLLEWAKNNNGYIIEDDYDSELTYRSRPIPSLQGLDSDDRVIYVGTFSKALSPALRVTYMILPNRLLESYHDFHGYFPRVSLTTQKTLELFLKEGHRERHLRRIRNLNRKKHDLMKHTLIKYLGDQIEIVSDGGGLSINIHPKVPMHFNLLRQRAEEAGMKLYFTNDCSLIEWEAIRMGFGGFEMEEIEPAVEAFAEVFLRETV